MESARVDPLRGVRRQAIRACVTALCLTLDAAAQATRPAITGAWRYAASEDVACARVVATGQSEIVLVATTGGRLHMLDAGNGARLGAEPLAAGRGLRFIGVQEQMAFCHDRYAVHALRAAVPGEFAWTHGRPIAAEETYDGDPEHLGGWCAAALAKDAVLVADAQGRILLLEAATGRPRWSINVGKLSNVALHATGERAVLLSRQGGRTQVLHIALETKPPTILRRCLPTPWPIWSALTAEGLVTATSETLTLWPPEGEPRSYELGGIGLRAAALALGTNKIFCADDTSLLALDLSAGRVAWRQPGEFESLVSLRCAGAHVGVQQERELTVCAAATGHIVATLRDHGRILDWRMLGTLVQAVTEAAGTLYVCTSRGEAVCVPLPEATHPREILWSRRHVVLLAAQTLTAYELPADTPASSRPGD